MKKTYKGNGLVINLSVKQHAHICKFVWRDGGNNRFTMARDEYHKNMDSAEYIMKGLYEKTKCIPIQRVTRMSFAYDGDFGILTLPISMFEDTLYAVDRYLKIMTGKEIVDVER